MQNLQIYLKPQNKSDTDNAKTLLESGYARLVDWRESTIQFSVYVSRGLKSDLYLGYVGIVKSDFLAGRGEIIFFTINDSDFRQTITKKTLGIFNEVLRQLFDYTGLMKLTILVQDNNKIIDLLDSLGFSIEGVRRSDVVVGQKRLDITVCSIMDNQWKPTL